MSETRQRTEVICIRVTRAERQWLDRIAAENRMSRATAIRWAVGEFVSDYTDDAQTWHVNTPSLTR